MSECRLCPRLCGADRNSGKTGVCSVSDTLRVARAALHLWEEPCISGKNGSGTVFFSGCSLGCVYCQNREISSGKVGRDISVMRLADIFLELRDKNAENINLVTPDHYIPQVREALVTAKSRGLDIPVVYNTSSYVLPESLKMLEGLVDVYLADYKYADSLTAKKYSRAADYPEAADAAIREMVRQTGGARFDSRGIMTCGVIVRHLVLPGNVLNSKKALRHIFETYGNNVYISIMSQYTPVNISGKFPELNRTVTRDEYSRTVDFALAIGVKNAYIQEGEAANESFIPAFDFEGV